MLELSENRLELFRAYLYEQEYAGNTVDKYVRDISKLRAFCGGEIESKQTLIAFKKHLEESGYRPSSINSILAAVNRFLSFSHKRDWKLRFLKIQKANFQSREKELSIREYERLVKAAEDRNEIKLSLIIRTICSTGIRVSELKAITIPSLEDGYAEIRSKGKIRYILIPNRLVSELKRFCRENGISSGPVFVSKSGRALDRSNVWKMMKRLKIAASVSGSKIYPHNLRHLFARTYYRKYRDIVRLADILGHSSIDTTRIYTIKNASEQKRQIDSLMLMGLTT